MEKSKAGNTTQTWSFQCPSNKAVVYNDFFVVAKVTNDFFRIRDRIPFGWLMKFGTNSFFVFDKTEVHDDFLDVAIVTDDFFRTCNTVPFGWLMKLGKQSC